MEDDDSLIIAYIEGPYDVDDFNIFYHKLNTILSQLNSEFSKDPVCKNWKIDEDWDKNEGFLTIEKKG